VLALAKFVGRSSAFTSAIQQLPAIAKSKATVFLRGETGTGKELAARLLHYLSPRAGFPFVPVNCGSLPETLLEDELFGHERGAFTDARRERLGLLVEAEQGTLFLDEVDSLSRKAQTALLRVLQDGRFRPLGASVERPTNIRIVVASNAPVEQLVQSGAFREDLFYRLNVFSILLPPLRERKDDLLLLADHFLQKHALDPDETAHLSPEAARALLAHHWPGNVRELENALLRAAHLCQQNTIEAADLGLPLAAHVLTQNSPGFLRGPRSLKFLKQEAIEQCEIRYLNQLMADHKGNVSQAALAAEMERRHLGKLLKKYHINPRSFHSCIPCSQ
jgi:DNA-binding NtrC family response regulator